MSGSDHTAIITTYLEKLDIEPDSTRVYIELSKAGPASALQLAKITGISRTQVYRHLEALQAHSLASAEQLSYGTLYRALPLQNIEGALANREAEAAAIRRNLGSMAQALQMLAGGSGPQATVQHYYGLAGLKQVNWNLTKATKEFRIFEAAQLSQHLDQTFARRCREQITTRGLHSKNLTNATTIKHKEVEPIDRRLSEYRHIDPDLLTITFAMYIYNDVVTLLDYGTDNHMAMEVQHPSFNAMMTQLFDAMWAVSMPLDIT